MHSAEQVFDLLLWVFTECKFGHTASDFFPEKCIIDNETFRAFINDNWTKLLRR
jgi:hypothetical protein